MYCTLGNIEFNLQTSPVTESDTLEISWAEHETINQPTKLQPTGRSLVERTLEIFLHQSFCKVEDQIKALTDAAINYDVMALVMGNGKLVGDFIITTIEKETKQRDELGNLIGASLTITLKEYIADKLQTEQAKADKKAFATGNKKGVTNKTKSGTAATAPCKTQVSNFCTRLQSYKAKESSDWAFFTQSSELSVRQNVAFSIRSHISVVKNLCDSMKSLHQDCLNQYNMDFPTDQLISTCGTYTAAMNGSNPTAQQTAHTSWQGWINQILAKSTAANTSTIIRR